MGNSKIKTPPVTRGKHINPKSRVEVSPDRQPPVFSLQHLQNGWCVTDCDRDDKAAFAEALRKLSQMTWLDIRNAPRQGLGTEKIARNAIRAAIPAHVTEDVTLLAIRFSGKKPMVGYRVESVFHVLWLDYKMELYDHG